MRRVAATALPAGLGYLTGALLVFVVSLETATAQPANTWPGRVEISASAVVFTGYQIGTSDATLVRGGPGLDGTFTLFDTETDIRSARGVEGRLGVRLSRWVSVEGSVDFATPQVVTRVSGDAEGAPAVTATTRLSQYVIDASVLVHVTGLSFGGGRGLPFIGGGGGYLRQLQEGGLLIETGRIFHVGGGVKYLFVRSPDRFVKGLGVRADARLYLREGGFDLEDQRRSVAGGAVGLLLVF